MSRTCYLCDRKPDKEKRISLHRFPIERESINNVWLERCGLNKKDNVTTTRVCSRHFTAEDFFVPCSGSIRGRLRPLAVPSIKVVNPGPPHYKPFEESFDTSSGLNNSEPKYIDDVVLKVDTDYSTASSSSVHVDHAITGNRSSNVVTHLMVLDDRNLNSATDVLVLDDGSGMSLMPGTQVVVETSPVVAPSSLHNQESRMLDHLQKRNRKLMSLLVKSRGKLAKLQAEMGKRSQMKAASRYSIEAALMDLKELIGNGMPQGWGFCSVPEGLFLTRTGEVRGQVTRSIFIKPNMTLEVRGRGKICKMVEMKTISCCQDIISVVKRVDSLRLCVGDAEGWCIGEGFLRPESNAKYRCAECAVSRRRVLNSASRASQRLLLRKSHIMGKLRERKGLKQQLKRLQGYLEKAKEELRYLRNPGATPDM